MWSILLSLKLVMLGRKPENSGPLAIVEGRHEMMQKAISLQSWVSQGQPCHQLYKVCPILFKFLLLKYEPISLYLNPSKKMEKLWPPACIQLFLTQLTVLIKLPPSPLLSSQAFHKSVWKLALQFQPFGKLNVSARESARPENQ